MPTASRNRRRDDDIDRGASFSNDRVYRYRLWRKWGETLPVCWVLLNPSTADETQDDPTIRRCQGYARAWGFGGVQIVNIFAVRATDPKVMLSHSSPIGKVNDLAIVQAAAESGLVVLAWGAHGQHLGRGFQVAEMLAKEGRKLHCLKLTGAGHPGHPLYLPGDLTPQEVQLTMGSPSNRIYLSLK